MTRDFSIQQKLMYSCICCFVASSYFDKTELDLGARHVTLCKFTHASSQPRWSSPRIVNHDCMMVVVLPSSVGACWMETASLYHPQAFTTLILGWACNCHCSHHEEYNVPNQRPSSSQDHNSTCCAGSFACANGRVLIIGSFTYLRIS
ncbi:hypothetical protein O6H91_09G120800 [Diphasiastrum complanatum]|uniref:Uncharacterized protein n=1 Tax=Diphasiastrum complanatum TaxID=34168 RepID=A0ACC2CU11_DIPCM|nr:hypothetical protein O6H91_09G120800 [Diphasiastrum complanatum]